MTTEDLDAYAILGVDPDASADELKAAHRRLVRRHHPDLAAPEHRAEATRRVQRINVAYGLVRDPTARAAYDRARAARRPMRARASALDRDAAAAWESLVNEAGRWAGRWWWLNRGRARRAAVHAALRTRRGTIALVMRLQLLAMGLAGALAGMVVPVVAGRLVDVPTTAAQLVGLGAGWWVGTARGNRRRLRALGRPGPVGPGWGVPLVGAAAIASAMAVEAMIG